MLTRDIFPPLENNIATSYSKATMTLFIRERGEFKSIQIPNHQLFITERGRR